MADYAGHVPARPRSRRRAEVATVSSFLRRLDWVLVLAVAGLVAFGLWAISGITRFDVPGDPNYQLVRQSIAVGVGVVALLFALVTPLTVLRRHWRVFYLATIGIMVLVFVYAEAIRGSKRWLEIGPFQFQPSEFGKVFLVIALAGFLVERGSRITSLSTVLAAVGLAAIPTLLVFLQPDLGTAMVYAAALAAVLLIAGTRWKHLAVLLGATALVVMSVIWLLPAAGVEVLKPYQTARLTGFTNPDQDPAGLTYNVKQSITAIGAGGIDGRGVTGASQTRLAYLPEHATDFVFASLAEQRGFFGAAILLLLYMLVVWRGLRVITVAGDLFSAMLAAGIVFAFLFQLFVNVGMTMGIAPVTGIPLPFVSVGGSSIVANLLAMGLLLSIHARGRLLSARR
jgi:rod shape determining protein RodA